MVGGHFSCMKKQQNTLFSKENLEPQREAYERSQREVKDLEERQKTLKRGI